MKKFCIICFTLFLLMVFQGPLFAEDRIKTPLKKQMVRDHAVIEQSRHGLARVISFMKVNPDLFPRNPPGPGHFLNEQQRITLKQVWQGFLDYMVVLGRLGERYAAVRKGLKNGSEKRVFYASYAIFLAQNRFAMEFIRVVEQDSALHVVLNEPLPEMGLSKGAYSDLKNEFLNPSKGADFVLMDMNYRRYGKSATMPLAGGIEEDREYIWKAAEGEGPGLAARNALQRIQDFGFRTWLPIQTRLAEWMGDTKMWRVDESLITQAQIKAMHPLIKPGDVLLARREWYLSNMGLPGFWTHSLLYVGTPSERRRYFAGDRELASWSQMQGIHSGDFEQLLHFFARDAYRENLNGNAKGTEVPVIESRSEGVSLSSLEVAASADALVVLRPRLPKISKAQAILRAFSYVGRPYDFNFDFLTDAEMVCTELVYKAYEPGLSTMGLHFPLRDVLGRKLMTANDMAKVFHQEYGSQKQQLDFILFLDGDERENVAYLSNVERFRKSWKRPKWHVLAPQ